MYISCPLLISAVLKVIIDVTPETLTTFRISESYNYHKEQAFLKARVAQNELSVEIGEASGLRVLACTGGSVQHGLYTHTWELVEHFCILQKGPRDVLLC